jgi:DNA repair protein RadD
MFDLYPHQEQVITELRAGFVAGHKRQVLGMGTGSGKTVIAAHIARSAVARGKKVLFIVHLKELAGQAVRHFAAMGLRVGILRGEDTDYSRDDDIVVASIQSIRTRSAPAWIDLIVIDEVHVLHGEHIRLMESWNALPFIGLSATPMRRGLGGLFTNLVRGPTVAWLTENRYLVPSRAYAPGAEHIERILAGVSAGTTTHGYDFRDHDLAKAVNTPEIVADIVSTWQKLGEDRQTLCFAVNIAHSRAITGEFQAVGIAAAHVDAFTEDSETREKIAAFRARDMRILSSVTKLATGFDVPDAACLILARPTLSVMLDMQMKGRGLRTAPGKTDCIILDHAGNCLRHGLPVHFRIPDLDAGEAPERGAAKRKDEPKMVACSFCGAVMEPGQRICPACGIDRPHPPARVNQTDGDLVEYGARTADCADDPLEWYLGFRWFAQERGWKPGWASNQFKAKFGQWPLRTWEHSIPTPPSPRQMRYIKSRMIAFARSKGPQKARRRA